MLANRRLSSHRFILTLTVRRDAQALARIAGVLARLAVVPERLTCTAADAACLVVELEVPELDDGPRRRLKALLAALVDVVEVSAVPPAAPGAGSLRARSRPVGAMAAG